MKKIITYCLPLILLLISCGSGQETSQQGAINARPNQNIRTSSDMNISPSNMSTSEPALKPSDTAQRIKPAVDTAE